MLLVEWTAWKCQDLGKTKDLPRWKIRHRYLWACKEKLNDFIITVIQANELNGKYPGEQLVEYRATIFLSIFI